MRERPVDVDESGSGREVKDRKRIDLSVPQVAGSAVAAVVAAKLASYFGVYGTILGAGVVSVVATCGGTLFQHFFRRTGEQLREATVPARTAAAAPSRTAAAVPGVPAAPPVGEFTRGTVYRARVRGWRRPVVAAALVFGVTMTGITTYELVSGSSFSGGGSTTVGGALSTHGQPSSGTDPASGPASGPSSDPSAGASAGPGSGSGGASSSGSPATPDATGDASAAGGVPDGGAAGGGSTQSPAPAPSATAGRGSGDGSAPAAGTPGASATPEPSASSRSGTDVQGRVGPAAR
ncbi:hypothetical protein [Streptomyces adustus]|uniref:hypothetical protein n=1 Tax=Streptomyces adustus TaxID=1609272 RepID=UPI00128E4EF4|nr:hypothetical protein [Streptomyces adustus]